VQPLAAGEHRCALGRAALAQVVVGALHPVHVDPDRVAPGARLEGHLGPVARFARGAREAQRLQLSARLQAIPVVGQVAVEQAVVLVLGQIDDPGARIGAGRLVPEAPHGLDRDGLDEPARVRRHLEHPAVVLTPRLAGAHVGLFTGQPAAARRDAAGAVDRRANQTEVLALQLT
jgi:hypothetical protein